MLGMHAAAPSSEKKGKLVMLIRALSALCSTVRRQSTFRHGLHTRSVLEGRQSGRALERDLELPEGPLRHGGAARERRGELSERGARVQSAAGVRQAEGGETAGKREQIIEKQHTSITRHVDRPENEEQKQEVGRESQQNRHRIAQGFTHGNS